MSPKIEWCGSDGQYISITIEAKAKLLNEKVANKSLMIAMNYLTENMETEDVESAE